MTKAQNRNLLVDTGASITGASAGLLIAGPAGAIIGATTTPILADIFKRLLSVNERSRIEKVSSIALRLIKNKLDRGTKPVSNAKNKKIGELFEGMLLTAKDTYEEKKIPFLAQLFATAPFTNTPIENMLQTLITSEQLSYRQLCLIAIIGHNEWGNPYKLADKPLFSEAKRKFPDEQCQGIYQDLNYLIVVGIIGQVLEEHAGPAMSSGVQFIVPSQLILLYPGKLLYNGMQLDNIEKNDLDRIIAALK